MRPLRTWCCEGSTRACISRNRKAFGAHVISRPDQMGNCVRKGSLEWVDHSVRMNGRPLNLHSIEITFAELHPERTDCRDGAVRWGGRLVRKNDGTQSEFVVYDC